jgi:hypothetical protein
VTWVTAALTAAKLSPSSATNGTSTAGDTSLNASRGEEQYTFSFVDQSGNPIAPSTATTVTFTVQNTGSNPIYIVDCNVGPQSTQVAAGTTNSSCAPSITGSTATITVDAPFYGSGTASATITGSGAGLSAIGTKTWINANDEPATACNSVSGTVVSVDKGTSTDTGGSYIIQTTVAGNFFITYDSTTFVAPATGPDTFIVQGTTVAMQTFEDSLSVGDTVTFTKGNCSATTGVLGDVHNMTNNVP